MTERPFSIFSRKGKSYFYVQFKNEKTGRYFPRQYSTRQTSEAEAVKIAWEWYTNGIPQKDSVLTIAQSEVISTIKTATLGKSDVKRIIETLQSQGYIKSAILPNTKADRDFVDYLLEFWDFDRSPYVREKLRRNHGIHLCYCQDNLAIIKKRWLPIFKGRLLGDIARQDIENFVSMLDTDSRAAKTKNKDIIAGVLPLRWAYNKGLISSDITQNIIFFSGKSKERAILTPEQAQAIFSIDWQDGRAKLANLLSAVTGLRSGEVLGLRWQDLGENCLYVRHSWNYLEGLKSTKNGEARTVQMPFPQIMDALKNLAESTSHGQGLSGFVFYSDTRPDQPFDEKILIKKLRVALRTIGMSEADSKKYTFHGWRHFYTSYMKDKINNKLLQSQTGHKTLAMLEHYSNHATSGDKERIQQAQISAFAGLLPERISTDKTERERNAHGQYTAWQVAA
ncbi:integrase [Candidatus Termititenax persephonae]|uniref:Integrase n=1 Tax=Candidatus Termititenax persephonae TaxID=2218525 RepID=A0A388TIC0_9BACT|nr:integrase [Candidatus Termititenax persephonae]